MIKPCVLCSSNIKQTEDYKNGNENSNCVSNTKLKVQRMSNECLEPGCIILHADLRQPLADGSRACAYMEQF